MTRRVGSEPAGEPRLELASCTLRPFRRGDEAALVRHANDRRISSNLRDRFPFPYTLAHAERWIAQNEEVRPTTSFAIEVAGEAAGGIGLTLGEDVFRRSAELGYWLGVAHHSRGIVTEAVRGMVEYAFATFDVCRLVAGVFEWNPASARVLENAGFTLESRERSAVTKDGRTGDRLVYALVRRSARSSPSGGGESPADPPSTAITWRLHLAAPPERVWDLLATDAGRARFWAESAVERDGAIEFQFPNGATWRAEVLEHDAGRVLAVRYLDGTVARLRLEPDAGGGTDVTLTDEGVPSPLRAEVAAGWVSVLLALKAAADHGADLRNHDRSRTWDRGYVDN